MIYKIQYKQDNRGWADFLHEMLDGNKQQLIFKYAKGYCEGTGEQSAESAVEELEDEASKKEETEYRIVTVLEGNAQTELRSMVKELLGAGWGDSLDYQKEVESRAMDLLELIGENLCQNCGYDMGDGYVNCGASSDGICPECGTDDMKYVGGDQ